MNIKPEVCASCACMHVCMQEGGAKKGEPGRGKRKASRQRQKRSRSEEGDLAVEGLAALAAAVESGS